MTNRDKTIDTLRGLAIFTMVAANMAGPVLIEPHPFLFRFYGSFAAPLFILISGMMVALTAQTKGHNLKYYLVRGMLVIAVGALIDMFIWRIYPFTTVDVLYLIGISLPLAYLFMRLNTQSQCIIVISIFSLTPFLQNIFGYADYPTEFLFPSGGLSIIIENQTNILNHWLVDGWFPVFPWLGFSLLGVILANLRLKYKTFEGSVFFLTGIFLLLFGSVIWHFFPGKLLTRAGYSEVFYPPTPGYIISAVGLIVLLFFIVDYKHSIIAYNPLQALGESALFMYILHLSLIEYVIVPIWSKEDFQIFLLLYIALSLLLILIAYGLRFFKVKWRDHPFIIRFLLGG
ncbi:MAG: heparan-alpha-glucosaminide N-acetyltransferase domain-containing protein [Candidatus Methanoperedens sp.]